MGTNWIDEPVALLSVDEMYRADAAAAAAGVKTGFTMSRGRGFVAARLLAEAGREVRLALLGGRDGLKGDAATNAGRWDGAVAPLSPDAIAGAGIVVDAIFGAGLARPLDGIVAATVEAVNAGTAPCLAVDVPSGVDGDTGAVRGAAIRADETVTFFRRKPAHLLYPGRGLCGVVRVADIGIPATVLGDISPSTAGNCPALWLDSFPWPDAEGHKYARGHVGVAGGETMTGAARLASHAALRAGAGLVTIFSPPAAGAIYRSGQPDVLVRDVASAGAFAEMLDDRRITTLVLGPGLGPGEATRQQVLAGLAAGKDYVLDADALSAFAGDPQTLFDAIAAAGDCILTPHAGEFARLFGDMGGMPGGKLARARAAARCAGAVVILKGADTVIAAPDGRAAINANAPPTLATAGAGDVLAGFAAGLLAQGMPARAAACAGVWLHGAAAAAFGPGLIASDIATALPGVLRGLLPPRGTTFTRSMR